MQKRYDVYAIGNAIMDLQLRVKESTIAELGLEKGRMKLVSESEQKKLLDYARSTVIYPSSGGSAANTVITIAQLGGQAAYGCLVGADDFGRSYASEMSDLGVTLHNAPIHGYPTGTCVVLITPDSERTMNTHLGASSMFGPTQVSDEHVTAATWLYIEGYLFFSDSARAAIDIAVRLAKNAGTKIAVSVSDSPVVQFFGDALRKTLESADLVFANFDESCALTGEKDEDKVFAKLQNIAPNVALTLGKRGARIAYEGQQYTIEASPVTAVDTTGAGDVFAGAFLNGICQDIGARRSGNLACFLAGKVVSQLGARLKGDIRAMVRESRILEA